VDFAWKPGVSRPNEGWLYLAVVIDLYARRVVGWAMVERMTAELVCAALTMALWRRWMPTGVIVHSDRGSHYCPHQPLLVQLQVNHPRPVTPAYVQVYYNTQRLHSILDDMKGSFP